ncbi:hypothetical protein E2C01_102549 [Portunus trituberculatus]|uniref:Uncharacterized protein n=1 Tax=Portunus trituberculatus TaxID=210409 RepID=A0A5B7KIL7_PORTR|nr:hypothetical protein [Portunus trituberculatus]
MLLENQKSTSSLKPSTQLPPPLPVSATIYTSNHHLPPPMLPVSPPPLPPPLLLLLPLPPLPTTILYHLPNSGFISRSINKIRIKKMNNWNNNVDKKKGEKKKRAKKTRNKKGRKR